MGHGGMKFSLASRELIADSVETMLSAHAFDAMICIPNCDKIVPGMIMGALRCNIPTIFCSGGPMAAGMAEDGTVLDLNSVFEAVARFKAGKINEEELIPWNARACPGAGSCSGMFTANSMNCPERGDRPGPSRQRFPAGYFRGTKGVLEADCTPRRGDGEGGRPPAARHRNP